MPADPPALGARGWGLGVAIASLATAAFYGPAVAGETFIGRDMLRVYAPLRAFWAARVRAGQLPDWFPYDGLGEPFPGLPFASTFHPVNALYLLLPLDRALALNTLLAVAGAALGTFAFARRFGQAEGPAAVAGVSYAFTGYLVTVTNNLSYLMAAATFPWALWAADRLLCRPGAWRWLAASLLLASILLAGDPQSFAVCAAGVAVLALLRHAPGGAMRGALWTLAVWTGALLLAAVQILPALVVRRSGMVAEYDLAQAQEWSVHPLRLVEAALGPLFQLGGPHPADAPIARSVLQAGLSGLWVDSLHVGLPVLVLGAFGARAAGARTRWIALGAAAVLLLLALGRWGLLYEWVHAALPPWRSFRYPEKLFPYLAFLAAIGAGAGLRSLDQQPSAQRTLGWWLLAGAAAAGALGVAELWAAPWSTRVVPALAAAPLDAAATGRLQALFAAACLRTAAIAALSFAAIRFVRSSARRCALLGVAAWVHLFSSDAHLAQLGSPSALREPGAFASTIAAAGSAGPGRERTFTVPGPIRLPLEDGVATRDEEARAHAGALDPSVGALWGIEPFSAYLPAASRRLSPLSALSPEQARRAAGAFSARWIVLDERAFAQGGEAPGTVRARDEDHGLVLVERADARPRASLCRPRCVQGEREALSLAAGLSGAPPLAPDEVALVCRGRPEIPEVKGSLEARWPVPERVEVDARLETPAILVVNDAFYEGWTAEVDGRPAEILPGNGAVRALPLEAGAHRVVFRYRTPGVVGGAVVSALTLVAGVIASAWERRRRRVRSDHSRQGVTFSVTSTGVIRGGSLRQPLNSPIVCPCTGQVPILHGPKSSVSPLTRSRNE